MTVTRMISVQFAKHTDATTFSSSGIGTPYFLEPTTMPDPFPRDVERTERVLHRPSNHQLAEVRGRKNLDPIQIPLLLRGFSVNAGAALDAQTETEVGQLLDVISGGTSTDASGTATTTTGGTGASSTLTVTSGTNVANGVGVLFQTDGDPVVREVVSGGGTSSLTLDRDYTGTVTNGGVLARSCYWTFDPAVSRHTHGFLRLEGEDWRRDYTGCMSDLQISVEEGQPATFSTSWMPSSWADNAEANPSFTAPTAGAYVMGVNCGLWIGDDKYMIKNASLECGHTIVPRVTMTASDGVLGYVVTAKMPVIKCRVYHGTTSLGELADSTGNFSMNKAQALTNSSAASTSAGQIVSTYDIALQVGNIATGAMYVRMPAATVRGRMVDDNGMECMDLEIHATAPSSGSPMRLHIF